MLFMAGKNHFEEAEEYIKKNLDKGYKLYDLKLLLKKQGYSEVAVNKVAAKVEKEMENENLKKEQKEKREQSRWLADNEEEIEVEKEPKIKSFFNKIKSFFKLRR